MKKPPQDDHYQNQMTKTTDYRIEEIFEPENMRVYFYVYFLGENSYRIPRQFGTLEEAKNCVRMCRKYNKRVFHYVED